MTQLLISVRSAAEAAIALAGGADLIDIKEPGAGSLGAASDATIAAIIAQVGGRLPVSAALGELIDFDRSRAAALPAGLSYLKLGLAGCGALADWKARFSQAVALLSDRGGLIAVVYADPAAQAPSAEEVLKQAAQLSCRGVLIDTFDKTRGNLLAHWRLARVEQILAAAKALNLITVLAGSLRKATVQLLLPLRPDYIAVRGAVCRGSRDDDLDYARVVDLARLVHAQRYDNRDCESMITERQA